MAAHTIGFTPAPQRRRWPRRILGVLATLAFMGSGVAIGLMVYEQFEDEAPATVQAGGAAATGDEPAKTGLTAKEKAARRAAVTTLSEQGFEPVRLADWKAASVLRVLVGRDEAGEERAFFFVGRRFVGNDDVAASASVKVTATKERTVTLSYRLFADDDTDKPTGETVKVSFRWRDGTLAPAGELPAADERLR
jgi:LppP/LprE lipoprotein